MSKAADSIQKRVTDYACAFGYESLPPEAVHAAKVRIIDTLGVLMGGFFGETCRIARHLAGCMPQPNGATVIGTRMKTAPDMAAFVNATTARHAEFTDLYHWPGSYAGHPSDVITPILAAAEHAHASGREFLAGVVLGYEIHQRFSDAVHNPAFDTANFCCLANAVGAGKMLGLAAGQLAHCIAMAAVPNVVLTQARGDYKSMYKIAVSGQAGRAGVFAALLARAGMEGPHLPFEGKAGWCDHVARERFALGPMGGGGTRFRILDSRTRHRPAMSETISSIMAAEKLAPQVGNPAALATITVEVYKRAYDMVGSRVHQWVWDPPNRECADQSIPYLVAATLIDGSVTMDSYDEARLSSPRLRALMQRIEVVENAEFTQAFNNKLLSADARLAGYERLPREHRTRITIVTGSGERLVAESGADVDDISVQQHDDEIERKFRALAEDRLGTKRADAILDRLWHLEDAGDVAALPALFALG